MSAIGDWQPIESAPKDGTAILAACPARNYTSVVAFNNYEWECLGYSGQPLGLGFYPTHWMPLPAPPTSEPSA